MPGRVVDRVWQWKRPHIPSHNVSFCWLFLFVCLGCFSSFFDGDKYGCRFVYLSVLLVPCMPSFVQPPPVVVSLSDASQSDSGHVSQCGKWFLNKGDNVCSLASDR